MNEYILTKMYGCLEAHFRSKYSTRLFWMCWMWHWNKRIYFETFARFLPPIFMNKWYKRWKLKPAQLPYMNFLFYDRCSTKLFECRHEIKHEKERSESAFQICWRKCEIIQKWLNGRSFWAFRSWLILSSRLLWCVTARELTISCNNCCMKWCWLKR